MAEWRSSVPFGHVGSNVIDLANERRWRTRDEFENNERRTSLLDLRSCV